MPCGMPLVLNDRSLGVCEFLCLHVVSCVFTGKVCMLVCGSSVDGGALHVPVCFLGCFGGAGHGCCVASFL